MRLDEATETGGNRVEQLANNFAAALLMPAATLESFGTWADLDMGGLIARLNTVADELQAQAAPEMPRSASTMGRPSKPSFSASYFTPRVRFDKIVKQQLTTETATPNLLLNRNHVPLEQQHEAEQTRRRPQDGRDRSE